MNLPSQIKRCQKCGVHFIYSRDPKLSADKQYCHDCRGDKYDITAVLMARVIEKMLKA
jgi:formylmethanofuran dehydrogenase subunit E